METNRLKQFCAVVELGGMTKASQLLRVTHSALSKSMKTLQDELGYELFRPHGRGLALTDDGTRLYQSAREFLAFEERLFYRGEKGALPNLKVGAVEVFLPLLVDGLNATAYKQTDITLLDLEPGIMEQRIAHDLLDFGVTYTPFAMRDIEAAPVQEFSFGCYCQNKDFVDANISAVPFVVPMQGLSGNPLGVKERDGWPDSLCPRKIKYRVNLLSTAIDLVSNGMCAVYIPKFLANRLNASRNAAHKLIELSLPNEIKKNRQTVFLLRHKNRIDDAAYKHLSMMLKRGVV